MDNETNKLEKQLHDNNKEISRLNKENEHLLFCLNLLKNQTQTAVAHHKGGERKRSSLRSEIFNLIQIGETVTIDEAWNRSTSHGLNVSKPTVNTSLHLLAGEGLLEKPSKGLYKRPAQ